jgi:anti-sigma-K factor RskA
MMSDTPNSLCDEVRPRLAAAALGEGDAGEDLRSHLRACGSCRRAYEEYVLVGRSLAAGAPAVEPPAGLRSRVIAAVSHPQVQRAAVRPSVRAPSRLARWAPRAAAALILAALVSWNVWLQTRVAALEEQAAVQSTQLVASREGWQTTVALLNNPDVQWYEVRGDAARGRFWAAPGEQVACLMAEDLPALAQGQVFQVWLVAEDGARSGGTFAPRGPSGWAIVRSDATIDGYRAILVTIEPAGGSATPSGPQVLAGTLTSAMVE